jgi:hypothetical protein
MKCVMMIFFISFLLILPSHLSIKIVPNEEQTNIDTKKLIQCKICKEMFDYDFNYEEMLKNSNKLNMIGKAFEAIYDNKDELTAYFSKDNMEFITKEISMQYFFKGADETTTMKLKECRNNNIKTSPNSDCEKIKFELCENILSYEKNICVDLKKHVRDIFMSNSKKKKRIQNGQPLVREDFSFEEKSILKPQPNEISLLDLSPDYIQKNFDSTPKSQWKPPKPVLLSNFENSIGDQLKDISSLARYYLI